MHKNGVIQRESIYRQMHFVNGKTIRLEKNICARPNSDLFALKCLLLEIIVIGNENRNRIVGDVIIESLFYLGQR